MEEKMKIIVCPNSEKMRLLREFQNDSSIHNIKFMTKQEYLKEYYYSYDDRAIYYLMKNYGYHIDVARIYLKNLYVIDIDKNYKSRKLEFLKSLKIDLMNQHLLEKNNYFKSYLSNKIVEVHNYYDLDRYEEEALFHKVEVPDVSFSHDVYEFSSMEDEVNYVCIQIIHLLRNGVDINKIFLCNVSQDYFYTIRKLFSYYKIPIELDSHNSIYSTKVVSVYLKTRELDLENKENSVINKKILSVLESLNFLEEDDPLYDVLFLDKLQNTNFSSKKLDNAVRIKNLMEDRFQDDEYVFVLGFNQDSLPKTKKDIEFITDKEKEEVSLYTTSYWNKRESHVIPYLFSNIKNLYLSYKLSTPFQSFYKSSLINDLGLNVVSMDVDSYEYSDSYNKIRLGEKLDTFYLFGEKGKGLDILNSHYTIPYKTYQNDYLGIDCDAYIDYIKKPLKLSYTSLNTYNECKFKYYIKNVLKLDEFTDTFASFIGSMYHKILSLYKSSSFNLEDEYQKYLSMRELDFKEKLLLVKIKRDLEKLLEVIKKQDLITGFDDCLFEEKIEISLDKKVPTTFIGFVDKIMYYKKMEEVYFSIVDYKSGSIDTHIEPMKYGLHMQLPVYLYLIHYGHIFSKSKFTGIYYQNILFSYPRWSPTLEKEEMEKYYLNGYSTDNTEILSRFDSTYEDSQYIKSMKYTDEKGFGTYSKIISDTTYDELIDYTKKEIDKRTDEILDADFSINPKIYGTDNVSCTFCSFKDLCFMREKDFVYLDKVKDLSFLGGDE